MNTQVIGHVQTWQRLFCKWQTYRAAAVRVLEVFITKALMTKKKEDGLSGDKGRNCVGTS